MPLQATLRRPRRAAAAIVAAVAALSSVPVPANEPARRAWPNSDQRLNFSAGLIPRQIKLAAPETIPVVAPSIIWVAYAQPDVDGPRGLEWINRFLDNERPRPLVGRYFSACSVRERTRFHPPETAPYELLRDDLLPNTWGGEAGRRLVDLRKPAARAKLVRHFIETARAEGDFLALDNFTVEYFTPAGLQAAEWDAAQYALLAELRAAADAARVRIVINASTRPEKTWAKLIEKVDGLLFEMPVHPNVQKRPEILVAELAAYRAALDRGVFVGLIPDPKAVGLVAAAAMLIREPGDPLFVSPRDSVPTAAAWMHWPAAWGPAEGRYERDGSRFTRTFARARLEIDFATGAIAVTPR